MLSNQSHYYLNQMGLTPWITKNAAHKKSLYKAKLVITLPSSITSKSQSLLNNLLRFINLEEKHIMILKGEQNSKKCDEYQPIAILNLMGGNNSSSPIPMLFNEELEQLILNPKEKKRIFADIMHIKQLLS